MFRFANLSFLIAFCLALSHPSAFAGYDFDKESRRHFSKEETERIQDIKRIVRQVTWEGYYVDSPGSLAKQIFELELQNEAKYKKSTIRAIAIDYIKKAEELGGCEGALSI